MRCALVAAAALMLAGCEGDLGEDDPDEDDDGTGGSAGNAQGGAGGDAGGSGPGSGGNPGNGGGPGSGGSGGAGPGSGGSGGAGPAGCTASGLALIDEVNAYRMANGLGPVAASTSMCIVAETHVSDLAANSPHTEPGCNLHSWSDQGTWSACCYTADHAQAQCMWDKPSELTAYPGNGYEISASGVSSANHAVTLWSGSPGHNAVMINQGIWQPITWQAMGAAIDQGFAVVWFGEQVDPMP
jgi:hypothetical protein